MQENKQELLKHSQLFIFLRCGVYALLLTPLVFWKPLDFFFDSTKAFYLMTVVQLMFVGSLWLFCLYPHKRPQFTGVEIAFFIYIFLLILASIFGVDPFLSFWSSADRMGGILVWLHLLAFFVLLPFVIRSHKDWQNVFFISSIVGLVVVFVYILTLIYPTFFVYSKGGSTLGNSTYLGTYLIFCLFFSAILAFSASSRRLRRFGIVSVFCFLFFLFTTSALAAIFAVIGGIIFACSLWLVASNGKRHKKMIGRALLLGLVLLFFFVFFELFRTGSFMNRTFIELSSGSRLAVWSIAWDAWKEKPFLGWGPENFPIAFFAHYDPCFGSVACGGEYWFDRAHNKILDTLIEVGILGLISYLSLLVISIIGVWKAYRESIISLSVPILVTTFFAVYFVQNLAEFDLAFSLLFFVLVLCYASFLTHDPKKELIALRLNKTTCYVVACAFTITMPFIFFQTVIYPFRTNRTESVTDARLTTERLKSYAVQSSGSPIGRDYRRIFLAGETAKWILRMDDEQRTRLAQPIKEELALGIGALTDTVERSPNQVKASNLLGFLYQLDARYFHPDRLQKAEEVLQRSFARNPKNQHAYSSLAAVFLDQGRKEEAFFLFQQAVDLDPMVPLSMFRMLTAMKLAGDQQQFETIEKEMLRAFPDFQDEIEVLKKIEGTSLDQLYAVFY